MKRISLLLVLVVVSSSELSGQIPRDLLNALRPLLTDSIMGIIRPDEVWLAADSGTLQLSRDMDLGSRPLGEPRPGARVVCPRSPDGLPADSGVTSGQAVDIKVTVQGDTVAFASMGVRCRLRANGRE